MDGNAAPYDWLTEICGQLRSVWRLRPALVDAPWHGPRYDVPAYQTLLACGLRAPYVTVLRGGGTLPASEYSQPHTVMGNTVGGLADPARLARLLEEGDTILLPHMDQWHAEVADLTRALTRLLERKVETFLFATMQGAQGLNIHRDDADVLVVQLNGSKRWRIFGPPAGGYWKPGQESDPGPVVFEPEVHPGHMVYIPRGFSHAATGSSGLSIHLSFTIREVGTKNLVSALHQHLGEGLRLPPRPLDDDSLVEVAGDLMAAFAARLAALSPKDLVRYARERQIAETTGHAVPQIRIET